MPDFTSSYLSLEMRGAVALLTLSRPDKRNAVSENMIRDVNRFFGAPPKDARVIVLHGAGEHSFLAGGKVRPV